jgi:hypothetical protein
MRRIVAAVITVSLLGGATAAETDKPRATRTHVVLLGTGTPSADPERSGPATAVVVDDTP